MDQYRTAFHDKKNDALEYNLEKVVNMASQKLKELINTKQEKMRENGLLKGQRNVLESDILHYEEQIKDKETQILRLNEEYLKVKTEVDQMENELKENLDTYNVKGEIYKHTITNITHDLDTIMDLNYSEEANKKQFLRTEYEQLLNLKSDNKLLVEQLYQLRRDLYYLEVYFTNF
jgi:hypothetical protein